MEALRFITGINCDQDEYEASMYICVSQIGYSLWIEALLILATSDVGNQSMTT